MPETARAAVKCTMSSVIVSVLSATGGLGMFLLGMLVMTRGLKSLVGGRLQVFLARRTQSPASGAAAGAIMTAVLQSSSATTVATVGFVGAGLLTFNQALGIIFGANVGTTITGWLVALIGFKLQIGTVLLPAVLAGVLLKLFGRGWLRHAGFAIAGFGLLFVGIDFLQQGMKALEGVVTPGSLPADTFTGRVQLVLIGIAITLVTQSSSAGVATALVALGSGSISFGQAAAIIIGMDVGTTFTALIASVGGSAATRRTGLAHLIYNVLTGTMAFCLLYPLQFLLAAGQANGYAIDPQLGLVAFHSFFNLLGVLAVIGFTPLFARLIVWLIPDSTRSLTESLDERLLHDANASTYAAGASAAAITREVLSVLNSAIHQPSGQHLSNRLAQIGAAVRDTRNYTDRLQIASQQATAFERRKAILHALDHAVRMAHRCTQEERLEALRQDTELARLGDELRELAGELLESRPDGEIRDKLDSFRQRMRDARRVLREETIAKASGQEMDSSAALLRLDAIRWLHRVSYHVWRLSVHLPDLTRELQSPTS